jgi:hypothetical protein
MSGPFCLQEIMGIVHLHAHLNSVHYFFLADGTFYLLFA